MVRAKGLKKKGLSLREIARVLGTDVKQAWRWTTYSDE